MLKKMIISFSACLAFSIPTFALAEVKPSEVASQTEIEKAATEIFNKIGGKVKSIKPSPVKGLYELLIEKDGRTGIVYLDEAQKHLIQGMVLDIAALQPVFAHPQDMLQSKQQTSLDVTKIPVESAFVMGNPKGTKKLYVFTDPDCPYCHKMHAELKKLVKIAPDVAIHIMLFPLPMHPGAYDKARVVLETMSQDLMDKAFEGKEVPKPTKDNSRAAIDAIIKFANENGIDGTPTLVLDDGKIVVGMRSSDDLKRILSDRN